VPLVPLPPFCGHRHMSASRPIAEAGVRNRTASYLSGPRGCADRWTSPGCAVFEAIVAAACQTRKHIFRQNNKKLNVINSSPHCSVGAQYHGGIQLTDCPGSCGVSTPIYRFLSAWWEIWDRGAVSRAINGDNRHRMPDLTFASRDWSLITGGPGSESTKRMTKFSD
jgi:hypothetical protein